jgi:hypothetical protein
MLIYENKDNISLSLAVWLAHMNKRYDFKKGPNRISVTTLIKPLKQLILADRVPIEDTTIDLSNLIASSVGSAIHDSAENAWKSPHRTMIDLGYSNDIVRKVVINPNKNELTSDMIPIYLEGRAEKEIEGWTVSGKYDLIGQGILEDYKTTSVYTFIFQSKFKDFQLQGSIYRWLNLDKVTEDYMYINYVFTDWSKRDSIIQAKRGYPQSRLLQQQIPLLSIDITEKYIINKIKALKKYHSLSESEIPECTKEELWQKDSVFKYYKNPNKTARASKSSLIYDEVYSAFLKDGEVGLIKEIPAKVKACEHCAGSPVCKQKDKLIEQGLLEII